MMTYSLPTYGVGFGDVDTTYTSADITSAIEVISGYFNLIRTYDDFNSAEKYQTLMTETGANNIDVILGIPNIDLVSFDASTYIANHAWKPTSKGDTTKTPWPNLKCIIVGNETYGDNYPTYAKLLADCVQELITEIGKHDEIKDQIAVSIDFGPALHEAQDLANCDFTGGGNTGLDKSYIVNAMTNILNSSLTTPKMVFGNLYPFYAPQQPNPGGVDLNSAQLMINQYAGTSTGWYPYTAALAALDNNGLSGLTLNCGETGWATDGGDTSVQQTSADRLTMYLAAYKKYIEDPTQYGTAAEINAFKGYTTVFFEMFDEPLKTNLPWEPFWGMAHSLTPGTGNKPGIKSGVTIPFKSS